MRPTRYAFTSCTRQKEHVTVFCFYINDAVIIVGPIASNGVMINE
jgi:hypothetical protein